jgi:hypothetical protein
MRGTVVFLRLSHLSPLPLLICILAMGIANAGDYLGTIAQLEARVGDDNTLLLFTDDETTGLRVTFAQGCTGLTEAAALSFVSASSAGGIEHHDSILLDDGVRCYFDRVYPTVFE